MPVRALNTCGVAGKGTQLQLFMSSTEGTVGLRQTDCRAVVPSQACSEVFCRAIRELVF